MLPWAQAPLCLRLRWCGLVVLLVTVSAWGKEEQGKQGSRINSVLGKEQAAPASSVFGQQEGTDTDLAQAIAKREAGKHADELTCSCNMAKKAQKFSAMLTHQLVDLELCRTTQMKAAAAADAGPPNETDGLLSKAVGVPATGFTGQRLAFKVQAVGKNGANRKRGGDQFWWGRVIDMQIEPESSAAKGNMPGSREYPLAFVDNKDGTYEASFVVFAPGKYAIQVAYDSDVPMTGEDGAPFALAVADKAGAMRDLPQGVPRERLPVCTDVAGSFAFGHWEGAEWLPDNCRLAADSHESTDAALGGKRVMFVGDSLIRAEFWGFATWVVQVSGSLAHGLGGAGVFGRPGLARPPARSTAAPKRTAFARRTNGSLWAH
jgi:hypothetical protein